MSTFASIRRAARRAHECAAIMLFVLVAIVSSAEAGVYKCVDDKDKGTFIYQEEPCPAGKELRNFDLDPPTLSVIPGIAVPPSQPARETAKAPKSVSLDRSDKAPGKVIGDATGRKFIHTGMTEAEVLARIGRPDITAGGSRSQHPRWSYLPTADDPDTITTITFNGDKVSDVTRKLVKR